jgi:hypothetical protein
VDPYPPKREDEEHCFGGDAKTEFIRKALGKLNQGKNENEIEEELRKARLRLICIFFPELVRFVFGHVTLRNDESRDI